jgi:hypothetical protein
VNFPIRIRVARKPSAHHDHTVSPRLSGDERLFALGTRTLADLIAPASAQVRGDHLQLDAHYVRVLVVTGYPRTVSSGWLAPLTDELDLPLELSMHEPRSFRTSTDFLPSIPARKTPSTWPKNSAVG